MMTPLGPRPNSALDPARLDGTNINPVTGLATDFLNHFNEAIMLLEVLPMAPECKADILAWRPMSYREHFATSHFKYRDLAIAAYEAADSVFRRTLDEITNDMNTILIATCDGLKGDLSPDTMRILATATAHWLRPLVARAGAVINGEATAVAPSAESAPQDAVDALFEHEVVSVFHC